MERLGRSIRRAAAALCLPLWLAGCGSSFVVLEPLIAPEEGVEVPGLSGDYSSGPPEAPLGALRIVPDRARAAAGIVAYRAVGRWEDSQEVAFSFQVVPAPSSPYLLLQAVWPEDETAPYRGWVSDPRIAEAPWLFLHFVELTDCPDGGRCLDFLVVNPSTDERVGALAAEAPVEIVKLEAISEWGRHLPEQYVLLGKRADILAFLEDLESLESKRFPSNLKKRE